MINYTTQEITIAGTDRVPVASVLADLSDFPEGSRLKRVGFGDGRKYAIVFHKATVDETLDYMFAREPDIRVEQVGLGGNYVIEFSDRVRPDDIGRIEEKVRSSH